MKASLLSSAFIALSFVFAFATESVHADKHAKKGAKSHSETYKVDVALSKIAWLGKKVTGQHNGTIQFKDGTIDWSQNEVKGGSVVVDMTTIDNLDLTDKSYNDKLVGHLKSDDFFGVEKFPTAKLTIKSMTPSNDASVGTHNVLADLTIKGKTHPVEFPASIAHNDNLLTAKAKLSVDRTKYDVRYGSTKFFDKLGDKAIYDDFTLEVDLVAKK